MSGTQFIAELFTAGGRRGNILVDGQRADTVHVHNIDGTLANADWIKTAGGVRLSDGNPNHDAKTGQFTSGVGVVPRPVYTDIGDIQYSKSIDLVESLGYDNGNVPYDAKVLKDRVARTVSTELKGNVAFEDYVKKHMDYRGGYNEHGDEYATVNDSVAAWADSSSDNNPLSQLMQHAAAQEFHVANLAEQIASNSSLVRRNKLAEYEGGTAGNQAILRQMYTDTQAKLAQLGVKELLVHRGYQLDQLGSSEWMPYNHGEATVTSNALSSWSLDKSIARNFGVDGEGEDGVIMSMVVPASRILSVPSTGLGCAREEEVVIIGGQPDNVEYLRINHNGKQNPSEVPDEPGHAPSIWAKHNKIGAYTGPATAASEGNPNHDPSTGEFTAGTADTTANSTLRRELIRTPRDGGMRGCTIIKNPTPADIWTCILQSKKAFNETSDRFTNDARYLADRDGNIYLWPAYHGLHEDGTKYLKKYEGAKMPWAIGGYVNADTAEHGAKLRLQVAYDKESPVHARMRALMVQADRMQDRREVYVGKAVAASNANHDPHTGEFTHGDTDLDDLLTATKDMHEVVHREHSKFTLHTAGTWGPATDVDVWQNPTRDQITRMTTGGPVRTLTDDDNVYMFAGDKVIHDDVRGPLLHYIDYHGDLLAGYYDRAGTPSGLKYYSIADHQDSAHSNARALIGQREWASAGALSEGNPNHDEHGRFATDNNEWKTDEYEADQVAKIDSNLGGVKQHQKFTINVDENDEVGADANEVHIIANPTKDEIRGICNLSARHGINGIMSGDEVAARYLIDRQGNMLVWPAYEAIHGQVSSAVDDDDSEAELSGMIYKDKDDKLTIVPYPVSLAVTRSKKYQDILARFSDRKRYEKYIVASESEPRDTHGRWTIESDGFFDRVSGVRNPSKSEVQGLANIDRRKGGVGEARYFIDKANDLYAWPAYDGLHSHVADSLHTSIAHEGVIADEGHRLTVYPYHAEYDALPKQHQAKLGKVSDGHRSYGVSASDGIQHSIIGHGALLCPGCGQHSLIPNRSLRPHPCATCRCGYRAYYEPGDKLLDAERIAVNALYKQAAWLSEGNPNHDAHGRFATGSNTGVGSPAFNHWFAGSQVTTPDGRPQIVYHGSMRDITEFHTDGDETKRYQLLDQGIGSHFAVDTRVTDVFSIGEYVRPHDYVVDSYDPEKSWYRDQAGELQYNRAIPTLIHTDTTGHEVEEPWELEKHGYTGGVREKLHDDSAQVVLTPPGGRVYPVYLSIKHPLVVTPHEREMDQSAIGRVVGGLVFAVDKQLFMDAYAKTGREHGDQVWEDLHAGREVHVNKYENYKSFEDVAHNFSGMLNGHDLTLRAKMVLCRLGYDGIRYINTSNNEVKPGDDPTCWIAFRKGQIKSASGNSGTWDELVPEINASEADSEARDAHGRWTNGGQADAHTVASHLEPRTIIKPVDGPFTRERIIVNPTPRDIWSTVLTLQDHEINDMGYSKNRYKDIRYLGDDAGNLYVFPGYSGIHGDMVDYLRRSEGVSVAGYDEDSRMSGGYIHADAPSDGGKLRVDKVYFGGGPEFNERVKDLVAKANALVGPREEYLRAGGTRPMGVKASDGLDKHSKKGYTSASEGNPNHDAKGEFTSGAGKPPRSVIKYADSDGKIDSVPLYVNPTPTDVWTSILNVQRFQHDNYANIHDLKCESRYLVDTHGNVYLMPGQTGTHDEMAGQLSKELGVKFKAGLCGGYIRADRPSEGGRLKLDVDYDKENPSHTVMKALVAKANHLALAKKRYLHGDLAASDVTSEPRDERGRWTADYHNNDLHAATFQIPTHLNDGTPVPPATFNRLHEQLVVKFGGFKPLGIRQGYWEGQAEPSDWYTVHLAHDKIAEFRDWIHDTGKALGQMAMYVDIRPPDDTTGKLCESHFRVPLGSPAGAVKAISELNKAFQGYTITANKGGTLDVSVAVPVDGVPKLRESVRKIGAVGLRVHRPSVEIMDTAASDPGHAGRPGEVGGSSKSDSDNTATHPSNVTALSRGTVDHTKTYYYKQPVVDQLLGSDWTPERVAALNGTNAVDPQADASVSTTPTGVDVRVNGHGFFSYCTYTRDGTAKVCELNDLLFDNMGTGAGTKIFTQEVQALRKAGFDRIKLVAARGDGLVGYCVWPKFGFDAKLPNGQTIQQLYSTAEGRKRWESGGDTTPMEFDLHEGSASMKVFNRYLAARQEHIAASEETAHGSAEGRPAKFVKLIHGSKQRGRTEPDLSAADREAMERVWSGDVMLSGNPNHDPETGEFTGEDGSEIINAARRGDWLPAVKQYADTVTTEDWGDSAHQRDLMESSPAFTNQEIAAEIKRLLPGTDFGLGDADVATASDAAKMHVHDAVRSLAEKWANKQLDQEESDRNEMYDKIHGRMDDVEAAISKAIGVDFEEALGGSKYATYHGLKLRIADHPQKEGGGWNEGIGGRMGEADIQWVVDTPEYKTPSESAIRKLVATKLKEQRRP